MGCCLYPPSLFLFRLQLLLSALLFLIPWAVQLGQLASLIGYQLKGCSYRAKLYDSGVSHLEAHLMRAHGFGCPRWEACLEIALETLRQTKDTWNRDVPNWTPTDLTFIACHPSLACQCFPTDCQLSSRQRCQKRFLPGPIRERKGPWENKRS